MQFPIFIPRLLKSKSAKKEGRNFLRPGKRLIMISG
jgi:hypothetical protein